MLGKVIVSAKNIEQIVHKLSSDIDCYYHDKCTEDNPLVILSILKGSVIFTSDLIRHIYTPLVLDFIEVDSYEGTQSKQTVRLTKGLTKPITGSHVLIVEDIIDTGLTMKFLVNYLNTFNPKSLSICTLLYKKENCRFPLHPNTIDFIGTEVPNKFLVGYGLDANQLFRNLTNIREWKE